MENRRLFERFRVDVPVRFSGVIPKTGPEMFLTNASANGARFSGSIFVKENDIVMLEVDVPDGHDPLILNGRIVWSRKNKSNMYDVGVEFHDVHFMAMRRICKSDISF
ncbi:MAG: PilZ domain-containing protein [Candidatus Omnitrophica bacterium]|nr:PilZ domain-containing protein [Candidatus Omnitrophota bacterium]